MSERQCVHVVVQDPTLVVCASHECLGLLLRADIESLVVDAFEAAFDHCISLLLCLKDALVQFDVLHAHSLSVDHHIARNSLCCIVYYMLLINQTVHLRSQTSKLCDAMSVVLILEDGTRQLLVEIEERFQWRELALVHFMLVVLHYFSIEVARGIRLGLGLIKQLIDLQEILSQPLTVCYVHTKQPPWTSYHYPTSQVGSLSLSSKYHMQWVASTKSFATTLSVPHNQPAHL